MKWIGQHIYDLISRFRNDVYLEDIDTGTIASGGNLGLDSNNKIVKDSGLGVTDLHSVGVDGANNQLLTDDGDGTITSEANLTFDGSTLSIEADSNTTADALFIDANSLTSGSAITVDVSDTLTTSSSKVLCDIDYVKSANTPNSIVTSASGVDVLLNDSASSNHVGSTHVRTSYNSLVGFVNTNGTQNVNGFNSEINFDTSGMASPHPGGVQSFFSKITNGQGVDFKSVSSANTADQFTINTTANGDTYIQTVDDDASLANLNFWVDGYIHSSAENGIHRWFKSTNWLDYLQLDIDNNGGAKFTTVDAASTLAHFEIEADGNITLDAADAIALEGSTTVTGNFTVNGDTVTFESPNADDPGVVIKNTYNDNQAARLQFRKDRGQGMVDLDRIGEIDFIGEDASQNSQQYAKIQVQARESDHGTETGYLKMTVAEYDGSLTTGFSLSGMSTDGVINATIGAGDASTTTVGGGLNVNGDKVNIYNAVNDSNPVINLGSSATNRLEIKSTYNSGAQTLDEVSFTNYTTSGATNDGRFRFYVDEVSLMSLLDAGQTVYGDMWAISDGATITAQNTISSDTTSGGKLILLEDDGAACADRDRIGVIEFQGAEDASNNRSIGARIQAICRDAWDGSNNDADLEFYTTDGTSESKVLTLNADGDAVTTGNIQLGHVSDTTIARSAAGTVTIEGDQIVTAGTVFGGLPPASGIQVPVGMQVARRLFSQAEVNDLHNTPITIIPAQGANLIAIPTHCTVFVDRASTNTGTGDLVFGYDSPASFQNSIFYSRRFHNGVTTDMHYEINRYLGKWGTSLTTGVNTVFDVHMTSALTNNCMTTMDVYVTYYVINRS